MTASELKRKDTIESAARVVCARLKRQGVKQPWRPVLEFLDKFDNPESEEVKTAAVAHFLSGVSSLAPSNSAGGLTTAAAAGDNPDEPPVKSNIFDMDATPRAIAHRSDSKIAVSAPEKQSDLVKKEAANLGLTLTEADIQSIGSELEFRHGRLCTDTALIVDALKQWVNMLEEQTQSELNQLHAGLAETISASHERLAARVSSIFTTAKKQQQEYAIAQSNEMEKIRSFFAAKGVQIGE